MSRGVLVSMLLLVTLMPIPGATAQQRQELLSTEEWVNLSNSDEKMGMAYFKGVLDTLGAIGNFTCTKPVVGALSAARIRVEFHSHPDKMQRWFIFALMADLTRNYHCRFTDTDRLAYTNEKLKEWEAPR